MINYKNNRYKVDVKRSANWWYSYYWPIENTVFKVFTVESMALFINIFHRISPSLLP